MQHYLKRKKHPRARRSEFRFYSSARTSTVVRINTSIQYNQCPFTASHAVPHTVSSAQSTRYYYIYYMIYSGTVVRTYTAARS